jgi:multidrug efflux system membrane fusion protein
VKHPRNSRQRPGAGRLLDNGAKKKAEQPPVPVTAAQAVAKDVPVTLQVVGRAEAFESVATGRAFEGGRAVLFHRGATRQPGRYPDPSRSDRFAARLQQAEATAARDEALIAKMR